MQWHDLSTHDSADHRRLKVFAFILCNGIVSVTDLARTMNSTIARITEDVKIIAKQTGQVRFIHDEDTVISFPFTPYDQDFIRRFGKFSQEKQAIAEYVVKNLIAPDEVLFLDAGSTALHIAFKIVQESYAGLDILTNNVYVLQCLSKLIRNLSIVGGQLRGDTDRIISSPAFDFHKARYSTIITSCIGLSYETGVYTREEFAEYKKAATLAARQQVIFIADHERIGNVREYSYISFSELEDRHYVIVTDNCFSDDETRMRVEGERKKFLEAGKRFEYAPIIKPGKT